MLLRGDYVETHLFIYLFIVLIFAFSFKLAILCFQNKKYTMVQWLTSVLQISSFAIFTAFH